MANTIPASVSRRQRLVLAGDIFLGLAIVAAALADPDRLVPEITPEEAARESEETTNELSDEADENKSKTRGLGAAE